MKAKSDLKSSVRLEVSRDDIVRDLREIGVNRGDHIAVALSFKKVGYVKGGPEAFIDALLEAVGPNGTIMMNTNTRSSLIFDHKSTPTWTGLIPETLRNRRNSIRSRHPRCSVTAIGKLAEYLTEGHDASFSPYMPYSRLAKVDGKYLCIGLGNNLVAIRHEAQYLAGLPKAVPRFYTAKYIDGEGKLNNFVFRAPGCVERLPELVPILKKRGIVKVGRIGMAHSIFAPARSLLDAMTKMLKKNPALNLCDDVLCLWCRELERRMNLYKKIEKPKYFQKNISIIKIIASINSFHLKLEERARHTRSGKRNEARETEQSKLSLSISLRTILTKILRMFLRFLNIVLLD